MKETISQFLQFFESFSIINNIDSNHIYKDGNYTTYTQSQDDMKTFKENVRKIAVTKPFDEHKPGKVQKNKFNNEKDNA